jgi:hypothetical protein
MTVADVVAADGMESKAAALLELVQSEHAPWDENAQACASLVLLRTHLGETRRHWLARSSVWWEVGAHTAPERARCPLWGDSAPTPTDADPHSNPNHYRLLAGVPAALPARPRRRRAVSFLGAALSAQNSPALPASAVLLYFRSHYSHDRCYSYRHK